MSQPGGDEAGKQLQQQDGLAERLRAALGAITLDDDAQRPKQNYAFWGTQPVAQFNEQPSTSVSIGGGCKEGGRGSRGERVGRRRCRRHCRRWCCRHHSSCCQLVATALQAADGPIDKLKTISEVRQEPYGLPQQ